MWLNPLKGAHLTLGQLDKTLPVDTSVSKNEAIERGSIVFISTGEQNNGAPRFQLYTSTEAAKPNAVPYVALMGVKDFQAGMAGNEVQAPEAQGIDKGTAATGATETWLRTPPPGTTGILGVSGIRGPRITAISLVQPAEWETTAYDKEASGYYVGMPLTVNNDGKLTPWEAGKNIVGYVSAVPYTRWVNDLGASADGARISGGNTKVIAFTTAWIPAAAVAAGDGANVGVLSAKGAKVDAKTAAPANQGAPAQAQAPANAGTQAPAGAKADNKPQGK